MRKFIEEGIHNVITLFLSDVHIGHSRSKPNLIIDFLETQSDAERLVIVGDLFDLWENRIDRILADAKNLIVYINHRFKDNLIYLIGNHDEDLLDLKYINPKIREHVILNNRDQRILVMHGHQNDRSTYLKYFPRFAKMNSWAAHKIDKFFNIDSRKYLRSISDFQDSVWFDQMVKEFNAGLVERTKGYDVTITGHTHYAGIFRFDKKVIINTGDWLEHSTAVKMNEDGFYLLSYEGGETKVVESYLYENSGTQIQGES